MAAQKNIDDCYFYYYSSCTKGDLCPFRHCEAALGTETVCTSWKEGRCFKSNCKFRHMESRINRAKIACYWENQPGGCKKPHCVFFHKKIKNGRSSSSENSGLILPVSNGQTSNSPKAFDKAESNFSPIASPRLEAEQDSASVPVAPIVVSLDEESDNESVSSTPLKASTDSIGSDLGSLAKRNLSLKPSDEQERMDFQVKTLEQIKMEKIHKESEHFYKSDYDAPALTPSQKTQKINNEGYPPKSDFISISTLPDTSMENNHFGSNKEVTLTALDVESDLRGRLTKRNALNSVAKASLEKRTVNFKKQSKNEGSSNPLDFKIKTLDEIRKERENKQGNKDTDSTNLQTSQSIGQRKRLKITRNQTTKQINKPDDSTPDSSIKSENNSQNVLQEVQTNNQNSLKETSPAKANVTLPLGKRKVSNADAEVDSKIQKLSPEHSTDNPQQTIGAKKLVTKGLASFLRKPLSKPVNKESSPSVPEETPESSPKAPSPVVPDVPPSPEPKEDVSTMETEDTSTQAVAMETVEKARKSLSIDELDPFLMDGDMSVEENGNVHSPGGDDILLEIDQFLDS